MLRKFSLVLLIMVLSGCGSTGLALLNNTVKTDPALPSRTVVNYGDKTWQTLDVYPQNETAQPSPVLVFIYGGAWTSGSKEQYRFAATAFHKLGYTVVVPNYVLYPQGKFPEFIEDVAVALAWVKENIAQYHGDHQKLFLVGHSAGAHTGALLSTDPHYLQNVGMQKSDISGFAGLAGPYGFTPTKQKYINIFGPPENFHKMKAMNHVSGNEPPMILMHGLADKTVGLLNQQVLAQKIRENDGVVEEVELAGVSHVGILLKLHPWFSKKVDLAGQIDGFFSSLPSQ